MLFNSFAFLLFFVVVTLLWLLTRPASRWIILLAASCFFYAFLIPGYLLVLLAIVVIDFFSAIQIERSTGKRKKFFLLAAMAANLSILFIFKYHDFLAAGLNQLLSNGSPAATGFRLWHLLLPLGLSFHTFQAMGYTMDVYRGEQKAERHAGFYALFVMFYPQLVAGPIERAGHLIPQLKKQGPVGFDDMATGLKWMLWGYFLKGVLADRLGIYVDYIFLHVEAHSRAALAIAAFFYSFQIYGDFAGYSLIALGIARCMGISLTANFRRPYLSTSLQEFWRRWNITLSRWFRDYVYLPLGGNRAGRLRVAFNLLVVFILSGLWHGANTTFLAWGLIHWVLLLINRFLSRRVPSRKLIRWLRIPVTFFCVTVAWIFFRAVTISEAILFLCRLFHPGKLPGVAGEFDERVLLVYGFSAIAAVAAAELYAEFLPARGLPLYSQRTWVRLSACVVLVTIILLFGVFDGAQFIYFQF